MKDRSLNLLIAGIITLSTLGGVAALLVGEVALGDTVDQIGPAPVLLASTPIKISTPAPRPGSGGGGATINGNSWGG
jgi:hypothetical protein